MSVKVHPLLIANLDMIEVKVLHFVPAGATVCQVCRLSKHRMRFHYTDEPEYWDIAQFEGRLGLVNPSTEVVEPFEPCRPPGAPAQRDPFAANIIAGNFGGNQLQ